MMCMIMQLLKLTFKATNSSRRLRAYLHRNGQPLISGTQFSSNCTRLCIIPKPQLLFNGSCRLYNNISITIH